ncbi:hypothetical protein VBR48_25335 [Klebsiella pneumoniae]|uniref:hypothetical protein n=1 Tax=Klebsiella pneumoniae TaxID=573 RepID=UPI00115D7216|nr:hypothetical protein [Klebsiella pneumoniae]HBE5943304.1 hypothetical protein [Escherichia coli]HCD1346027.1 hypothetical protein [Klebsiella pneumoniae subsp. pneumoniae]EIW5940370.1 hypothetical protein [Klebsiella pneumoniae]MEA4354184.1 hypothetical protein [Klebsiella pneumoniae]MEA4430809.1 hypothetical protein [Klebsiella pneumoniae]
MKRKCLYLLSCGLFLLFFMSRAVLAECHLNNISDIQSPLNLIMPLNVGNITVGNEVHDGTVVSRQFFKPGFSSVAISCSDGWRRARKTVFYGLIP